MKAAERSLDSQQDFARLLKDDLAQWSSSSEIDVEVWALPKEELPGESAELFRGLIREVLAEVGRHGAARTVSIALTTSASGVRLTISDDAAGMPDEAFLGRLACGHARLAELGGYLRINTVPLEGSTVSGALPCRRGVAGKR